MEGRKLDWMEVKNEKKLQKKNAKEIDVGAEALSRDVLSCVSYSRYYNPSIWLPPLNFDIRCPLSTRYIKKKTKQNASTFSINSKQLYSKGIFFKTYLFSGWLFSQDT